MNDHGLVSILMPAYNAQAYIQEAIQSIVDQTYTHWELLICDDASRDKTYEIIKEIAKRDPRIKILKNDTNLKQLKTRNKLLEIAKGNYITFQDADDYSDKSRLEKIISAFKANPNLGMVSSQVVYVDPNGAHLRTSKKPEDYKSILQQIYNHNVVGGAIMVIKKEALESVGGRFRPYFDGISYQDYDLSFLIAQRYECCNLPEALYYYRQHGQSSSKRISIDRLLAKEVVIHLAKQRQATGSDDLMDGHPEKVDAYFDKLRAPYIEDSSLIYREFAANFMYNKLYRKAINAAWSAIRQNPLKIVNWRVLQYCIRKSTFSLFVK
jgi:glycosyltransferase involved in cell wall biosynthesis